jgi:hypothetical protein
LTISKAQICEKDPAGPKYKSFEMRYSLVFISD